MEGDKLRFLVDEEEIKVKSALPIPGLEEATQAVVEISGNVLKKNLDNMLRNIFELIDTVTMENEAYFVSETRFSLVFDAEGEISIVSLAKGSLKGQTGLEFTIERKPNNNLQ